MKISKELDAPKRIVKADNFYELYTYTKHSPYPVGEEALRAEIDRLRDEVFRLNRFRYNTFEKGYNKGRYKQKKTPHPGTVKTTPAWGL